MRNKLLILIVSVLAMSVVAYAADITGTWTASFDTQIGPQNYMFTFKVEGTKLTGHMKGTYSDVDIAEGTINGDDITFVENMTYEGMPLRIVYKGKISGEEIKLSRTILEMFTEEAVAKRSK